MAAECGGEGGYTNALLTGSDALFLHTLVPCEALEWVSLALATSDLAHWNACFSDLAEHIRGLVIVEWVQSLVCWCTIRH